MRIKTLTIRILNQLRHDRRTVALVVVAPLLVLTLVYFILDGNSTTYKIGISSAPEAFISQLEDNEDVNIEIVKLGDIDLAKSVKDEDVTAAVEISDDLLTAEIYIDGTDASKASKIQALIQSSCSVAFQKSIKEQMQVQMQMLPGAQSASIFDAEPDFNTKYVYGTEDAGFFDNFGAPLIGLIVFFFVFLIAGINFLGERTSGTLEKMLSTPIKRSEIIIGYVLGFSILALIQTILITLFVVFVLDLTVMGSLWYVLLINLLTAITALTLGILLSTLAQNEFQMVQFIPLVILPQVFLCGLFELSSGWQIVGDFMPLHYTTDALKEVMLRGNGFSHIWLDALGLLAFSLIFMIMNIRLLKRQRSI